MLVVVGLTVDSVVGSKAITTIIIAGSGFMAGFPAKERTDRPLIDQLHASALVLSLLAR